MATTAYHNSNLKNLKEPGRKRRRRGSDRLSRTKRGGAARRGAKARGREKPAA